MIGRRRFLKLLGVGTASAPLAAKEMTEKQLASLTSLRGNYVPALAQGALNSPRMAEGLETFANMRAFIKIYGRLPKHVERQVHENSKHVHALDPDIACKRSWSLNVKIMTQQQRNYQHEVKRFESMGWFDEAQEQFEKTTGFRWRLW